MSVSRTQPVKHTCNIIDSAKEDVEDFKTYLLSDITDRFKDFDELLNKLEELRSANDALRSWGNDLVAELEEIEEQKNTLESTIDVLEERIQELENN